MSAIYVFTLVLGGGFLLLSVLGDIFGADADMELDGGDLDLSDMGEAAGSLSDAADAGDVSDLADAGDAAPALKILSIRSIVYALFGFGAVGTILTQFTGQGFMAVLISAIVGGLLCGTLVTAAFHWLKVTDVQHRAGDRGFVGLTGSITLPLAEGSAGSIVVERGQRRVTLRALPHETAEGDPGTWRRVMVVEMRDGIARVAPGEENFALEP